MSGHPAPRPTRPASRIIVRRPEARFSKEFNLAIGRLQSKYPRLACYENEVGNGYRRSALDALRSEFNAESEKKILERIENTLERHRIQYGLLPGSPDKVVVYEGRFLGFELKAGKNDLEPSQVLFHGAAHGRGVFVTTCRAVDEIEPAFERALSGEVE
jgi:hypothetical protein